MIPATSAAENSGIENAIVTEVQEAKRKRGKKKNGLDSLFYLYIFLYLTIMLYSTYNIILVVITLTLIFSLITDFHIITTEDYKILISHLNKRPFIQISIIYTSNKFL